MIRNLRSFTLLSCVLLAFTLAAPLRAAEEAEAAPELPEFNKMVLDIIATYPTDGTHDYWWPKSGGGGFDGCSMDMYLLGEKVMDGEPQKRTFCCGLTLEVFLRAYNAWLEAHPGVDPPVKPADWSDFQRTWFVLELNGPGPSAALVKYGIGEEVLPADVLPGDFVQIWRTKNAKGRVSGHSVIFLEWVRNAEDAIIGFRYWSTQTSTKGVNERVEYFGPLGGMSTEYTFFGRVKMPEAGGAAAPEATN
ncbi:MAG: hypothetical protein PWP23_1317 [Candidatus Sumerlaeota bacterium]|nr:hypothetical protein [Candidatus Sumerlaeota bacterium]